MTRKGQRRRYALDRGVMRQLASSRLHDEQHEERVDDAAAFFAEDRLVSIPTRRKKRVAVLQRLMQGFEPGRKYGEREVNDILRRAHDDVATPAGSSSATAS